MWYVLDAAHKFKEEMKSKYEESIATNNQVLLYNRQPVLA
jgi:hypothetical protein